MEECKKMLSRRECKKRDDEKIMKCCSRIFHTCPKEVQETKVR
jgi:hypothetical protein